MGRRDGVTIRSFPVSLSSSATVDRVVEVVVVVK